MMMMMMMMMLPFGDIKMNNNGNPLWILTNKEVMKQVLVQTVILIAKLHSDHHHQNTNIHFL